jgi:hypothetical protein
MRYRLGTLLVLMAIGPPVIALAWWYWQATLALLALAFIFEPAIFINAIAVTFIYGFGALCQLIGGNQSDNRRKNSN